jgi:ATP-dependent DNA ligase
MLSRAAASIPDGDGWLYEPKWDGFRALLFWDGSECYLQSRDSKPLGRYFPELIEGLPPLLSAPAVLDGEVVIMAPHGLDFGALQQRLHPAESRVRRLAAETPATFVAFDLLALDSRDLRSTPLAERRAALVAFLEGAPAPLVLTPATTDAVTALDWFERFEGAGFDGVMAKRLDTPYVEGERTMLKVKHRRTADCVVAGFRWHKDEEDVGVGSLLLGLYDDDGVLHHIGHTSTFTVAQRRALVEVLTPHLTDDDSTGFGTGRTPGGQSRWSGARSMEWVRLRPELVCEVAFDQMQGDRFRHGSTFLRWRPDKPAAECSYDQLAAAVPAELRDIFGT